MLSLLVNKKKGDQIAKFVQLKALTSIRSYWETANISIFWAPGLLRIVKRVVMENQVKKVVVILAVENDSHGAL